MASAESRDIVEKLPARNIKKIYKAKPKKRKATRRMMNMTMMKQNKCNI